MNTEILNVGNREINLTQVLKLAGWAETGGQAKAMIDWHKAESVVLSLTGDLLPAYGITVE